jgi:hypothetical protein
MWGILLTNGWASVALLLFRDPAAVWAKNHHPAYASTGITLDDFSAAVKEVCTPPDMVTRLKHDWDSLRMNGGQRVSAFNEWF